LIKAVLFDFHNTLVTCDGWLELEIKTLPGLVLRELAERSVIEDHTAQREESANSLFRQLRQRVRESGREISAVDGALQVLREMGYDVPEAEVESAVERLEYACLPGVRVLPGVDETLSQLRDTGYVLGVVSSAGFPPFVELALEATGLRPYFSEVITSAGEGLYKSDPEIYRRAAERLGALPHETVHIGDHPAFDVEAAKSAGLRAIWFVAQSRRTAELRGEPWYDPTAAATSADATVDDMGGVVAALQRL
jgi:HAD superfamily hydrolase (TIGR01509 family)